MNNDATQERLILITPSCTKCNFGIYSKKTGKNTITFGTCPCCRGQWWCCPCTLKASPKEVRK